MSEARDGRVPPNSLDAERAVLGGILLENRAMATVVEMLESDHFYSSANGVIFETMKGLEHRKEPIDQVTLRAALVGSGKLAAVGGDDYLLSLSASIPTVANIEAHARIVKEKAVVRGMLSACHEIAATGYGDYGLLSEFLDASQSKVFNIAKEQVKNPYAHISDVVEQTFERIKEMSERGDAVTGLETGFTELDMKTAGMHPGDLIIVAARPGMGKTAFSLNVCVNAAAKSGQGVAIFSLEMPKAQLAQRMLGSEARVNGNRLRTGRLTRDDWPQLIKAAGVLTDLTILIDDTPAITLLELRGKAQRIKAEHGLGLIVVDYLQLMRSGMKTDSREQEISTISRELKGLAKELEIPVIALSQLNRGVESRPDKRPQLSDLRESGAIEQDADTIWFIYRDEVYNEDTMDRGVAEIIVGKQRAGETGKVRVRFTGEHTRFDNLAREDRMNQPTASMGGGGGGGFSDA